MPRLMGHVGAEIPPDDAMPGGVVLLVELFLDVGGNVLGTHKRTNRQALQRK